MKHQSHAEKQCPDPCCDGSHARDDCLKHKKNLEKANHALVQQLTQSSKEKNLFERFFMNSPFPTQLYRIVYDKHGTVIGSFLETMNTASVNYWEVPIEKAQGFDVINDPQMREQQVHIWICECIAKDRKIVSDIHVLNTKKTGMYDKGNERYVVSTYEVVMHDELGRPTHFTAINYDATDLVAATLSENEVYSANHKHQHATASLLSVTIPEEKKQGFINLLIHMRVPLAEGSVQKQTATGLHEIHEKATRASVLKQLAHVEKSMVS